MKEINGFRVIASEHTSEGIVILGARERDRRADAYEYVVATLADWANCRWPSGQYTCSFTTATKTYTAKLS